MTNILSHYFDAVVQFNRMERYIASEYIISPEELHILIELYIESRTWTYLMYELNLTARILCAALDMLRSKELIDIDTKRVHTKPTSARYLVVSAKGEALLKCMYEKGVFSPFLTIEARENVVNT